MIWIVKEIHGAFYRLLSEDLLLHRLAVLRGRHRMDRELHGSGIPYRNPLCVGDRVAIHSEAGSGEAVIESVEPRRNMLCRSSPSEIHMLGSNIDRAVVVASLKTPPLRSGFIDRFLLACSEASVHASIFFTKVDLFDETNEEDALLLSRADYYASAGIPCYYDNLLEPGAIPIGERPGLATFLDHVAEGTTLLTGHSGTGKSTLTNCLLQRGQQKTSDTSESTGKGRHTTTSSELFPLAPHGFLIDTPGIKEWGLAHMSPGEILEHTLELSPGVDRCRFRGCQHTPETEGCAIQALLHDMPVWRRKTLDLILEDRHERVRPGDYKKATGRLRRPTSDGR